MTQGAGDGTKERVADIYDQAVYALQAWEREAAQESAVGHFAGYRDTVASGMNCSLRACRARDCHTSLFFYFANTELVCIVQLDSTSKTLLDVSLPLWRRTARCLDSVVPTSAAKSALSSVLASMWGEDGDGHGGLKSDTLATDGCIAMGLSADDCDAVGQMLSPKWSRNATALTSIRREIPFFA